MTIISNSFAPACRHLPKKYTISTLQSVDIADTQHDYGCILKFFRFFISFQSQLASSFGNRHNRYACNSCSVKSCLLCIERLLSLVSICEINNRFIKLQALRHVEGVA